MKRVQVRLSEIGFSIHNRTTSWRKTNVKVDIFSFDFLSAGDCDNWNLPRGSFQLDPKCFFPALPSLNEGWKNPEASTILPDPVPQVRAQLRYGIFKGIDQPECASKITYSLSTINASVDHIVKDIVKAIDDKLVPFWSRFEEPAELLRALKEDDDVLGYDKEGLIQIGSKGSHIRLFYLGFAALWLEDYELALSALSECRKSRKWEPSDIPGDFDPRPVVRCIDDGIVRAHEGLARQQLWGHNT